jgi:hypothetical protein
MNHLGSRLYWEEKPHPGFTVQCKRKRGRKERNCGKKVPRSPEACVC